MFSNVIFSCYFRLQEIQQELENATRAKDSLERLTYNVVDEMRQLKNKIETQTMDLGSTISDLKSRNKKLEDEARLAVSIRSNLYSKSFCRLFQI